jgi:hypothetical protein
MLPFSRRFRGLTILFAALQLCLPAALGVADAISARNGSENKAHVESSSGSLCKRPHADDCITCAHIATNALPAEPEGVVVASARAEDRAGQVAIDARSAARRQSQPRAPPAVLV